GNQSIPSRPTPAARASGQGDIWKRLGHRLHPDDSNQNPVGPDQFPVGEPIEHHKPEGPQCAVRSPLSTPPFWSPSGHFDESGFGGKRQTTVWTNGSFSRRVCTGLYVQRGLYGRLSP